MKQVMINQDKLLKVAANFCSLSVIGIADNGLVIGSYKGKSETKAAQYKANLDKLCGTLTELGIATHINRMTDSDTGNMQLYW